MVDVCVGVDHCGDGTISAMGPVQGDRCGRGLRRDQRIDDDDSSRALDQSHVRQVSAPHLVEAVGHLEQALDRGQLTLAPQTRIDGVRGIAPHGVGEPSMSNTTRPSAAVITPGSSRAINPRFAFSKSVRSARSAIELPLDSSTANPLPGRSLAPAHARPRHSLTRHHTRRTGLVPAKDRDSCAPQPSGTKQNRKRGCDCEGAGSGSADRHPPLSAYSVSVGVCVESRSAQTRLRDRGQPVVDARDGGPRKAQTRASSRATAAVRALRPCRPSFTYVF